MVRLNERIRLMLAAGIYRQTLRETINPLFALPIKEV
jgi:hypothetical protein